MKLGVAWGLGEIPSRPGPKKENASSTHPFSGVTDASEIPNNHPTCIKPVVNTELNNHISTGEFTGFLNHQQYVSY